MKTNWGVEAYLHAFLASVLDGDEWSASCHGHFTLGEKITGTHWIGGWVGLRNSLEAVEKRKILITAPAGNRTLVVHFVA
jgi:hypothetical protein